MHPIKIVEKNKRGMGESPVSLTALHGLLHNCVIGASQPPKLLAAPALPVAEALRRMAMGLPAAGVSVLLRPLVTFARGHVAVDHAVAALLALVFVSEPGLRSRK